MEQELNQLYQCIIEGDDTDIPFMICDKILKEGSEEDKIRMHNLIDILSCFGF